MDYIKLNELCKMIRREDFTVFLKAILVGLTCSDYSHVKINSWSKFIGNMFNAGVNDECSRCEENHESFK